MPITIGSKKESDFTDPIGLLTDCHRRIELFLSVLQRVAQERSGQALEGEYRTSWEKALQYFRHASPKHTADEEESLFPRLRAASGFGNDQSPKDVERLHAEHAQADELHQTIDEVGQKWLSGILTSPEMQTLQESIHELGNLYAKHIRLEEDAIFPLSARVLSNEEKLAIGREMAERRGVQRTTLSCGTPANPQ